MQYIAAIALAVASVSALADPNPKPTPVTLEKVVRAAAPEPTAAAKPALEERQLLSGLRGKLGGAKGGAAGGAAAPAAPAAPAAAAAAPSAAAGAGAAPANGQVCVQLGAVSTCGSQLTMGMEDMLKAAGMAVPTD